jgi:hypothetical protein
MGKVAQTEDQILIGIRNFALRVIPDKFTYRQLQKVYEFSA